MSEKAVLLAESYEPAENQEDYTLSDAAEERLNEQQKQADGFKIEGLALPFGERSRNGVIYEKESVKERAASMIGNSMLFNHDKDNPIGFVEDVWIVDDNSDKQNGLYYRSNLEEDKREVESVKQGSIPYVSIQAMIEEHKETDTKGVVAIAERGFLELSNVTVPGFPDTNVMAAEEIDEDVRMVDEVVDVETESEDTQEEQDDMPNFEFQPVPNLVLYDNEGDARERANDLGIEGIHTHEIDGNTFYMAGTTHGEWEQLVGKKESLSKLDEALKRKKQILGEKTTMTENETNTEQLEDVAEDDFMGTVADMYEELSASDAASLLDEFEFSSNPEPIIALVADIAGMTPADLMDMLDEASEGDYEDDEDDMEDEEGDHDDDEEEEENKESESSDLNGESQDSNDMSSKTKEELESRIEELEETIMELEDTEPSKQEAANGSSSNDDEGFQVRKDIKERLER